jgi:MHS family proline/betaine transporter-like MFS transporter
MKHITRAVFSSVTGNALEWYDYTLYSAFATTIAALFFPIQNKMTGMIAIFAVFAVGFVARPIGALIFSYIGDKYGRKNALSIAIMMMAIPTTLLGFLPTYEQIGVTAPILLVVIRIIQGISLGGEFGASAVYLVECAPQKHKGFFGSMAMFSIAIGVATGSIFSLYLQHNLTSVQMATWGWRVPFICSIFFGIFGLYIRSKLGETDEFIAAQKSGETQKNPIWQVLKHYKSNLLITFMIAMGDGVPFYVLCIFLKSMMEISLNYSANISTLLSIYIISAYGVGALFSGFLADRIGENKVMLIAAVTTACCVLPMLKIVSVGNFANSALICILAGFVVGCYHGPIPKFISELFTANVRTTGLSLGYNLSLVCFGGTAPMVASIMISKFNNINVVGYYVILSCIVSCLAIIISTLYSNNTGYEINE